MRYHIDGITIAVTDMPKMLDFYGHIFDMTFTEQEMYGNKLYSAHWGGLNLLFCPAALAQNTAKQNRQQFDIVVDDLESVVEIAKAHGGVLMSDIQENENGRNASIYDPDKNSIVFAQKI